MVASDGDIGNVEELYFDEEAWGIRYLVVKTGNWSDGRRVLVSPYSVIRTDPGALCIHVELTRQQVSDSPPVDLHQPVSRQHEAEYLRYYGYPTYWGGLDVWGVSSYPAFSRAALSAVSPQTCAQLALYGGKPSGDSHLHSTNAVDGYHVAADHSDIGHVSGFIFDDEAWVIRYLAVDTQTWWPSKEVLLATQWIYLIDWFGSTVLTEMTRDSIRDSPVYDSAVPLERDFETQLYAFYGKAGYWS
ncbi:PRC-barrel domain-containing protein [Paraburkholderia jirisanensis]